VTPAQAAVLERLKSLAGTAPASEASSPALPGAGPALRASGRDADTRSLRVGVATLDRILDLTGEIAVGRERLREALESEGSQKAAEIHQESDRLLAELQELVMKARMEPLGPTFRRFARTVRDTAAALGKSAHLVVEGEDVEVDTKVVEQVRDPLTHLVRNALAHGIEPADKRTAKGKPPRGRIRLRAFRETGGIVIEVEDDGAGLSLDRIAHRGREMGLLPEGPAVGADVANLIFEPGFSTAAAVTEVSGRGVGLDVVRRNVEALRGSVAVTSKKGQGTTFTIRLPLSLAIIPGFAVRVGAETYVVPLEGVVECLELPAATLRGRAGSGILNLRDEALACRRLRDVFGIAGAPPAREHVVVMHHAGRRLGVVVDALLGESQTVLKPLGRLFRDLPLLAGSAILGSGRVALVVDLPALFREAA
jgi:two-component system chemotaxis sensor kinase CheA